MKTYRKSQPVGHGYANPHMDVRARSLNRFNPGRQYRSEEIFAARLDEVSVNDARVILLRDVYNAGTAGKRLDCGQVLNECRKYYPSCFTLQDVFEDLIAQTPRRALSDVQYAFACFHSMQIDKFYDRADDAAQPALSLG